MVGGGGTVFVLVHLHIAIVTVLLRGRLLVLAVLLQQWVEYNNDGSSV